MSAHVLAVTSTERLIILSERVPIAFGDTIRFGVWIRGLKYGPDLAQVKVLKRMCRARLKAEQRGGRYVQVSTTDQEEETNNKTPMKPIAQEFTSKGFDFKLIKRQGLVALFSKKKPHWDFESFEVVKLHTYPEEERFGKLYPERELMPSDETWGLHGFTYPDREAAEKRFVKECKD